MPACQHRPIFDVAAGVPEVGLAEELSLLTQRNVIFCCCCDRCCYRSLEKGRNIGEEIARWVEEGGRAGRMDDLGCSLGPGAILVPSLHSSVK